MKDLLRSALLAALLIAALIMAKNEQGSAKKDDEIVTKEKIEDVSADNSTKEKIEDNSPL